MKAKLTFYIFSILLFTYFLGHTQCDDPFTVPFIETFDETIPNCWEQGTDNEEDWLFSNDVTNSGHIGDEGNVFNTATRSGGYFAYVDDSSPNNVDTELLTPLVDLGNLDNPILSFYYISHHEFTGSNVTFSIDIWDGTSWHVDKYTHSGNSSGWEKVYVDLTEFDGQTIQAKFVVVNENNTGISDDFAIDDIYIGEMPTCLDVNSIVLTDLTANSVTLNWEDSNTPTEENWHIVSGTPGFDPNMDGTEIRYANNTSYLYTGLIENTAYDFYIRTLCYTDNFSLWTGPIKILTPTSVPFIENFEDNGLLDSNWTQETTAVWKFANESNLPHHIGDNGNLYGTTTESAGYFAWVDASFDLTSPNHSISSPLIDISTLTNPALSFYYISNREDQNYNVNFSIDVWDGALWVLNFFTSSTNTVGWEKSILNLATIPNLGDQGPIQLRFNVRTNNLSQKDDFAIDDIRVDEKPDCWPITNPIVSNETTTTVNIEWSDVNNELSSTTYSIEYGPAGFTLGSGMSEDINPYTNPYTITGLEVDTDWDFYAIAHCPDGDSYSEPIKGTTLATCFKVVVNGISNITENSATITWSDHINTPEFYEVEIVKASEEPTGTGTIVTDLTYNFTNLQPLNTYTAYIRAKCGTDDFSRWTSVKFTTTYPSEILDVHYNVERIPYKLYTHSESMPFTTNSDDRFTDHINLGFNFNYFGFDYAQVCLGTNSVISFDPNEARSFCDWHINSEDTIPNVNVIDNAILGPYQDYYDKFFNSGTMSFVSFGTAPFRKFVFYFDDVSLFGSLCNETRSTNQIILYESYNFIDIQIKDRNVCTDWNEGNAILGIQSIYGQYAFSPENRNTGAWEAHNEGHRFSPDYNIPDYQYIVCDTNGDSFEIFDLETIYTYFLEGTTNTYTSFETKLDAETNTNAITSSTYTNITNAQTIFVREFADDGTVSIKRVLLATIDCSEDYDLDTIDTLSEDLNGNGNLGDDDTDEDGIPDFMDEDDDGDYVLTNAEAVVTTTNSTTLSATNITSYLDTDGDSIPNYLDDDDDGDGIPTLLEDYDGDFNPANDDTNGDGIPDYMQTEVASINSNNIDLFTIYPNPAKDNLTVTFNQLQDNVSIKLYTLQGQQVYSKKDIHQSLEIDISNLNSGVYFINVMSDQHNFTRRFIKVK